MKKLSFYAVVCTMLCTACSGHLKEDDYTGAFTRYAAESAADNVKGAADIIATPVKDITVGDSIDYITYTLSQEYLTLLSEKKQAWEKKQEDCEKDEKANILRREEHLKNYERMKRQYGNDIKYQSKIEGYKKAADRLPANHEEYIQFDRRRSYSFTLDAENLKAEYEALQNLGAEGYVAQSVEMQKYAEASRDKVLATTAEVCYTQAGKADTQATYLFLHEPLRVAGEFDDETPNIFDYKLDNTASEVVEN